MQLPGCKLQVLQRTWMRRLLLGASAVTLVRVYCCWLLPALLPSMLYGEGREPKATTVQVVSSEQAVGEAGG